MSLLETCRTDTGRCGEARVFQTWKIETEMGVSLPGGAKPWRQSLEARREASAHSVWTGLEEGSGGPARNLASCWPGVENLKNQIHNQGHSLKDIKCIQIQEVLLIIFF